MENQGHAKLVEVREIGGRRAKMLLGNLAAAGKCLNAVEQNEISGEDSYGNEKPFSA
jgi:hypothetical protein